MVMDEIDTCITGGVPWLTNTDGELRFLCKENVEGVRHFLPNITFFQQFRQ